MRKYDIPYVQNVAGSHPFPIKELEDMSLEEIVQKHIKTCGKANGNVAICSQCKSPCKQGKGLFSFLPIRYTMIHQFHCMVERL